MTLCHMCHVCGGIVMTQAPLGGLELDWTANTTMQITFQGPCDCSLTFSRHTS